VTACRLPWADRFEPVSYPGKSSFIEFMKICVLHNNFYRSSGSAIVIRRIFESFEGHPVSFYFAGCRDQAWGGHTAEQDTSWMPPGVYQEFNLMRTGPALASELARFANWLKKTGVQIVHAHHRRLAMLANLISPVTGIPVIYTGHNTFEWSRIFWLLAPKNTTGVSSSVVAYLRRATRARNVELIWNPLAFEPMHAEPSTSDPASVISVGRLEPVKGHVHLIEAWKILKNSGRRASLTIIGEGRLRADLAAKISADGLQDLVTLEHYKPNVQDYLRRSSFNVLVSETEGFPNVVVEAAAVGRASLVTDVDGSRDCISPNTNLPNLVPFGNPEVLARALAAWLDDPVKTRAEGRLFYDFLKNRCDTQVVRESYQRTYGRVIQRRHTGEPLISIERKTGVNALRE